MKQIWFLFQVLLLAILCGCSSQSEISKTRLTTGYYKTKKPQGIPEKRYVLIKTDTIWTYPVNRADNRVPDTSRTSLIAFPKESEKSPVGKYTFKKQTWDFNFQTIIFKFRPETAGFPNQLNTEYNLNLYFGRRTDSYKISYQANPLEFNKRKISHIGYSFGIFTGLGETPVSGNVTRNQINYVYEGVVWLNGVSATVGNNHFTLGLGFGIDQLLDVNRDFWIYERKPWVGLQVGIKL